MITASQILYERMGRPVRAECAVVEAFRCWVCAGESTRGEMVSRWMGGNFVGQNRVRAPDSAHVCEACVVIMSGKPPDTMRMYSHLVDDRGWLKLNKGNKPQMREWLRAPKCGRWIAAIADSGQKHIIPWCYVNESPIGGRVLFEEMPVALPRSEDGWAIVDAMTSLLTAGATKEEIERGEYSARAWALCQGAIGLFESGYGANDRSSPFFSLALWLAQRDEAAVQARLEAEKSQKEATRAARERKGKAAVPHRRGAARDPSGVPAERERERAETLGSAPGPGEDGGTHVREPGRVGDERQPIAQAGRTQLGLFGGDDGAHPRGA